MSETNSPITFCIGACNNLNYLKLAIDSVRKYSYFEDAPFIIYAENCTDGTNEWLKANAEKYRLTTVIETNDEEHTQGIGGGMNVCAKLVKTEFIMFLHADMVVSHCWDSNALSVFYKYPYSKLWVSSQRFQPNIWKEESRPGTLMFDLDEFGYKYDNFNEPYFIEYAREFMRMNTDKEVEKGEGVSGLIRKADWDYIGGNDPRFAPAYWEDTDLFIRMQLAGYKFVMTSNSVVFHFGSRSDKSNFPTDEIVRSDRSKEYERRGAERFVQKWGFWPTFNENRFVTYPKNIDMDKSRLLIQL